MKKLLLSLLITICAIVLVGCGETTTSYEIAMVTDYGDITDQSFNQTTWEAVKAYATEHGKTYAYYKPAGDSTAERVAKIEQAISQGAKVVVMPGYAFAGAIYECQDQYPEVKFIALDVSEFDIISCFKEGETPHVSNNVVSIVFQEEESGYLAGYAAVKNGETKLGFLGGMAVPAVIRFGYGYVQGAAAAAKELGKEIEMWYVYGGQFYGDATIKAAMDQWVSEGCETIFACGGGIFTSVVDAIAGKANCKLIGVDTDQSKSLPDVAVLTSAMKGLTDATITCLDEFYGEWKNGGKVLTYGLKTNVEKEYVGLPRATWTMEQFTIEQYDTVLQKIRSGEIVISGDTTVEVSSLANEFITFKNSNLAGSIK